MLRMSRYSIIGGGTSAARCTPLHCLPPSSSSVCAVLEERLTRVQCENDVERSRLQGLIAKMESNLADQNRQLEKVPLMFEVANCAE